jgi:YD repeat-containing protein
LNCVLTYSGTTREVNALGNSRTLIYDANGNLTQLTDEDGYVTRYDYNPIQTPEGVFNYTRDPAGRIQSLSYPNGITETYTHDATGQLLSINNNGTTAHAFGYLPCLFIGNIRKMLIFLCQN